MHLRGYFLATAIIFHRGSTWGGGVTSLALTSTAHNVPFEDDNGNLGGISDFVVKTERASPLTLTLGYQHAFSSGFALGAHLLNTLPTTLKVDTISFGGVTDDDIEGEIEIEDFSIRSIGLLLGYAW